MSNDKSSFSISTDMELMLPQKQKGYPISIDEWKFLKEKISKIKDDTNIYLTIASILFGVTGSALLAVFTYDKPNPITIEYNTRIVITISTIIVSAICGCCLWFFGLKQKNLQNISSEEVIRQMELIEERYKECTDDGSEYEIAGEGEFESIPENDKEKSD